MAGKPVVDAVEAYLQANWTATPIIGVNLVGDTPADGSAFLTLQYPVAKETFIGMASVGARTFREDGVVRLVLSVPRAQGQGQALAWIETLRDLFRAQTLPGPVIFRECSPAVTDNSNDSGAYWVMSFAAVYYFDAFK